MIFLGEDLGHLFLHGILERGRDWKLSKTREKYRRGACGAAEGVSWFGVVMAIMFGCVADVVVALFNCDLCFEE